MCFDDDFGMDEYEKRYNYERQQYVKLIADTFSNDGELIFEMVVNMIAKRFGVDKYAPIGELLDYYIENVDMSLNEWLFCDNAPLLIRLDDVGKIFYEFKGIAENDFKIVELANKTYGLDLHIDYNYGSPSYVYAFEFNFNSFTPIDVKRLYNLKKEIEFCEKYGAEPKFSLTDEEKRIMEML
ncbi:MAG: hypothetical protein J6Y78_11480 [Paludibacteraceae bacterium]|nr:hypothetical protein [Paludibacteraceae bacterium]